MNYLEEAERLLGHTGNDGIEHLVVTRDDMTKALVFAVMSLAKQMGAAASEVAEKVEVDLGDAERKMWRRLERKFDEETQAMRQRYDTLREDYEAVMARLDEHNKWLGELELKVYKVEQNIEDRIPDAPHLDKLAK